eukprot:Opistho-2@20074
MSPGHFNGAVQAIGGWDETQVSNWLVANGLGEYEALFKCGCAPCMHLAVVVSIATSLLFCLSWSVPKQCVSVRVRATLHSAFCSCVHGNPSCTFVAFFSPFPQRIMARQRTR